MTDLLDKVMDIEKIPVNAIQKIRICMLMSMPHPIHLHGQQFQIISGKSTEQDGSTYNTVWHGFINSDWKTILVMPAREIDIIKPSKTTLDFFFITVTIWNTNLGMMRNFYVS